MNQPVELNFPAAKKNWNYSDAFGVVRVSFDLFQLPYVSYPR